MTIKELFEKNRKAYNALRQATIKRRGVEDWESNIMNNVSISAMTIWDDTPQGADVWRSIHFNSDFTLFNEWAAKQLTNH
jgi:hypothetical protein